MSSSFDNGAMTEFVSAVRELAAGKNEDKRYLTGTVSHTDLDGTVWVNVAGGVSAMPVSRSTASYSPGDVVSFSIENGVASMGGNVTDPAAGGDTVVHVTKQVDIVENHVERIERVKADRVETDILNAAVADIETAMVGKADIDDLTAANAQIEQLQAADATITGRLDAAEADIGDLEAEDVRIGNLVAGKADISALNAATARIGAIEADYLVAADMTAEQARVGNLLAGKADVDDLTAATARIGALEADHVSVSDFEAEQANIDNLQAATADIGTIRANSAKVNDVTAQQITAATGYISDLTTGNVTAANLIADHGTIGSLDANYAQIDMANVNNAWITSGTIKDGAISSAMINDLSANKLTVGSTLDASKIYVTNLNADNITVGTINGQRIGTGSLSLDKLADDVYTEAEVDSMLSTMQSQIDGAIETWTGTAVPTLNNSPASSWTTTALKDSHVGDVYFVVNSQSQQNGYNYRFTKSGSTYSWQLIKDSDVTNALQRLTAAEGKITTFDSDISTLKTDTGSLTTRTTSLETRVDGVDDALLDKVDVTDFNELEDTVDGHTQTLSQHSTAISNKADGSTVTALTTRVNKNETDISGINTTIGQLQTTVESKADGSTVTTISNKLNTVSDTVDGHTQTISSVQSTLSTKADSSTVSTLRSEYNETKTTVSGHETRLSATESVANGVRADFDNLEIGGRNLLWHSAQFREGSVQNPSVMRQTVDEAGYYKMEILAGKGADNYNASWWALGSFAGTGDINNILTVGDVYTVSMVMRAEGSTVIPTLYLNSYNGYKQLVGELSENWSIVSYTFIFAGNGTGSPHLGWSAVTAESTYWIKAWKIERGNKATDWTPAPEDLETEVTTLKSDYATYKQTTTEALSEIGTTYATKTELGTETSNRQTAIQQLNDTISSKANASDVYTKQQTDGLISTEVSNRNSAIQQSAEAITQSVSSTYATKTELSEAAASAEVTRSDLGKREIITEDAAELPLLSLTAYGECVQDGTPTPDAPVPIKTVRGRNLFDSASSYEKAFTGSSSDEYATVNSVIPGVNAILTAHAGETLTFSADAVSDVAKTLYLYANKPAVIRNTFVIGSTPTRIRLTLESANTTFTLGSKDKTAATVTLSNVQIEAGAQATSYVPYGCIGVTTTGKNLLDCSRYSTMYESSVVSPTETGYSVTHGNSWGGNVATTFQRFAAGTYTLSYTLEIVTNSTMSLLFDTESVKVNNKPVNSSGTWYTSQGFGYLMNTSTQGFTSPVTVTATSDFSLAFAISSGEAGAADAISGIQLERGTEATEYEPYRESVAHIDFKGHEAHGLDETYQDTLTVDASGHVLLEKRTKKLVWDDVVNFSSNSTRVAAYTNENTDVVVPAASEMPVLLATHLVPHIWSGTTVPGTSFLNPGNGAIGWNFSPGVASTLAELKALYPDAYSIHPLKESQTIDLGYITPPTTFDNGTIHVDAEIQPVIDASWWTKAGYESGKAFNEGNTSADLTALEQRVTTAETSITQQAGQIALKASQSSVDTLAERVTTAESTITQQAGQISSKVSQTDYTGATVASLINQSADSVKIQANHVQIDGTAVFTAIKPQADAAYDANGAATAVQENLDNLEIGGRNLLRNTNWSTEMIAAFPRGNTGVDNNWMVENPVTITYDSDNGLFKLIASSTGRYGIYQDVPDLIEGETYIFSVDVGDACAIDICKYKTWNNWTKTVLSDTGRYVVSFVAPSESVRIYMHSNGLPNRTAWYRYPKLEKGNKATAWTPAPEDTDAAIAAVKTTADNAAPKTQAVKRTQRIYYRKSASGAPSTPGSWVTNGNTDSGWTKYNAWSTRVPPIAESNAEGATKYLYLYTCEQREMGDGTLAYTTVLLDDSTTVIDGGNIITGSVAANKIVGHSISADQLTVGVNNSIADAATTATNYITSVTNDGIVVAEAGKGTSNGAITSDTTGWHLGGVLEFIKNGVSRFWIGLKSGQSTPTVRIGKDYVANASDNESHMELDYHSLQMIDKDGSYYLYVSDLRGSDGTVDVSYSFTGDGNTTRFNLPMRATNQTYDVKLNGTLVSSDACTRGWTTIVFSTAPSIGDVIVVEYTTRSIFAKAFSFGERNTGDIGPLSVTAGYLCKASGFGAHAVGAETSASGMASCAEGASSTASGSYGHAEGYSSDASGYCSHSEGFNTTASGLYSHAEGYNATASATYSHAEGSFTQATGYCSHVEGYNTTASGNTSHAEGYYTEASSNYSHAQNYHTIAASPNQTALGKWNVSNANSAYALIIGNGTDNDARSNGAVIDWLGNYIAQGWAGVIQMFAGEVTQTVNYSTGVAIVTGAPAGWLLCDGSAVSRTRYATLYAAIGDTWGAGDGSTTFNLPDLRGRAPIGAGTGSGLTARTLGGTLGSEYIQAHTHGFTQPKIPNHAHSLDNRWSTGSGSETAYMRTSNRERSVIKTLTDGGGGACTGGAVGAVSGATTGTAGNMQPSAVVNFIIHTGKTS